MSRPVGARVLVVDDEPAIVRVVATNLARHGFQIETAATGQEALDRHESFHPDVVVLDLGLPVLDGQEVVRRIRAHSDTPIIILSVRGAEHDKITALDLGADDYLTKPFGIGELLARLRVALRHLARPASGSAPIFRTGDLEVDLERRQVRVGGEEVHLSPTEYDLLKTLVGHPNRVVTDRTLLQQVWGLEYGSEAHYLHVYVARLRKKLERDPQNPRYLVTEPGVGYRLLADES